ncbi:unnamed protein product [Closterium sp. NIES-54]
MESGVEWGGFQWTCDLSAADKPASSLACSSPAFPPSLAPCSPAPSPSEVSPSPSLPLPVPPCIVLTQSHHVSPDPPVPRSQLPSSTVRSFHIPLRLLPPSCDLSGTAASSHYCYHSRLLGGEKREAVVGCR